MEPVLTLALVLGAAILLAALHRTNTRLWAGRDPARRACRRTGLIDLTAAVIGVVAIGYLAGGPSETGFRIGQLMLLLTVVLYGRALHRRRDESRDRE